MTIMERFFRRSPEPLRSPESPHDLAHKHAVSVVGFEPTNVSERKRAEYWDRYYNTYYDYLDRVMSNYLDEDRGGDYSRSAPGEDDWEYGVDEPIMSGGGRDVEELRDLLAPMLKAMGERPSSRKPGVKDTMFFRYPEAREEVFDFSKSIAEYLKNERIKDLVIVDRSSRPLYVGVMEYWKKVFQKYERPGIYFVNPKGFKNREVSTERQLRKTVLDARHKEDRDEPAENVRSQKAIISEFKEKYARLFADRSQPILIFDTCIHSGDTLASVVQTFKEMGFKDVRVGSINPASRESKARVDFYITKKDPEGGCYPFDKDRLIEKTFEHVYSRPTSDSRKRAMSIALRQEIKGIMQERLG